MGFYRFIFLFDYTKTFEPSHNSVIPHGIRSFGASVRIYMQRVCAS